MGEGGVTSYVEVGPGKTLSALVRKIHPQGVSVANVENRESLTKLLESHQEVC
jgi:ribosomal protein L32E